MFIGLTYNNKPVAFNVNNIGLILDVGNGCHIYIAGNQNPFNVDQSLLEIQNLINRGMQYE